MNGADNNGSIHTASVWHVEIISETAGSRWGLRRVPELSCAVDGLHAHESPPDRRTSACISA